MMIGLFTFIYSWGRTLNALITQLVICIAVCVTEQLLLGPLGSKPWLSEGQFPKSYLSCWSNGIASITSLHL